MYYQAHDLKSKVADDMKGWQEYEQTGTRKSGRSLLDQPGQRQEMMWAKIQWNIVCLCSIAPVKSGSFATLWAVAPQALLSMRFSRQENWSGLPSPPPGDVPNPGIKPMSLTSPALAGRFFTSSTAWEAPVEYYLATKRNKDRSFVEMGVDLEFVIQSEIGQKEKNKYCMLMHVCGI